MGSLDVPDCSSSSAWSTATSSPAGFRHPESRLPVVPGSELHEVETQPGQEKTLGLQSWSALVARQRWFSISSVCPGHYISDITGENATGWLTLNNSDVTTTTETMVLKTRDEKAYILFYDLCMDFTSGRTVEIILVC
ncbi:hypothetical protein NHX12_033514 [Muraenolepis orangiensis]|uniref:Peptidase C19 ubiquitin carboxyl-terminal hydrolase domain-containing protein n=1 Tax=Muraenolepis orangiensis TaxID=630683 RepID=A0A9Q0E654_9TELE|nr:hypothetical protein NHX12_033514 [Muraenolepis orangiensis]